MGQASQARWSNDDDEEEKEEIITIGQVCLIGDSVGSILSYDALCRKVFKSQCPFLRCELPNERVFDDNVDEEDVNRVVREESKKTTAGAANK